MKEVILPIPFVAGTLNTEKSRKQVPFKLIKMDTCFYYGDCKFKKEYSSNTSFE